MTVRSQIVAVVILGVATYGVLLRIAENKVEAAVGGGGAFALDDKRAPEFAAFHRLRTSLIGIGEQPLADRLERLRQDGAIWVAPSLGPDRWAIFAEALRMVRTPMPRRSPATKACAHRPGSHPWRAKRSGCSTGPSSPRC